jgi:hypothetical protein
VKINKKKKGEKIERKAREKYFKKQEEGAEGKKRKRGKKSTMWKVVPVLE